MMNLIYKRIRNKILAVIISIVDIFSYKNNKSIAFVVGKGNVFSGNIKAAFDYFYENHDGQLNLLAHSESTLSLCDDKYRQHVIVTNSAKGLLCLLKTKCIIYEYCSGDYFWPGLVMSKHLFVNLWHSITIKKIGLAESETKAMLYETRRTNIGIASSHIDRAMISSCLGIRYKNVLLAGAPRNDYLISEKLSDNSLKLNALEQNILSIKKGRRLVLYAPTFRGHFSSKDDRDNGVYNFKNEEWRKLRDILKKNNAILGIRPHINKQTDSRIMYDDTIVNMSRDIIPDVQVLLRNTDMLISDYSGVWVDYLLLNRPIIGFVYDWVDYKNNRGFLYDYSSIFPGALVETVEDFFMVLERILSDGEHNDDILKRKFVKKIFHYHDDGQACKRLYGYIREKMKE